MIEIGSWCFVVFFRVSKIHTNPFPSKKCPTTALPDACLLFASSFSSNVPLIGTPYPPLIFVSLIVGMMTMSLSSGVSSPSKSAKNKNNTSLGATASAEFDNSRRVIANKETAAIMKSRHQQRDNVKAKMLDDQRKFRKKKFETR